MERAKIESQSYWPKFWTQQNALTDKEAVKFNFLFFPKWWPMATVLSDNARHTAHAIPDHCCLELLYEFRCCYGIDQAGIRSWIADLGSNICGTLRMYSHHFHWQLERINCSKFIDNCKCVTLDSPAGIFSHFGWIVGTWKLRTVHF